MAGLGGQAALCGRPQGRQEDPRVLLLMETQVKSRLFVCLSPVSLSNYDCVYICMILFICTYVHSNHHLSNDA